MHGGCTDMLANSGNMGMPAKTNRALPWNHLLGTLISTQANYSEIQNILFAPSTPLPTKDKYKKYQL